MNTSFAESILESGKSRLSPGMGNYHRSREIALGHVYPNADRLESAVGPSIVNVGFMANVEEEQPALLASLRFLHPVSRFVGAVNEKSGRFTSRNELTLEEHKYTPGHEVIERVIKLPPFETDETSFPFRFYPWREFEPLRDKEQQIVGAIVRSQAGIEGLVKMQIARAAPDHFKFSFQLENRSRADGNDSDSQLLRTFVSARIFIHSADAELVCPEG